jgi:hypothetical protein
LELRSKICAIGSVPASSDYGLLRRFRYELWSATGSGTTAGAPPRIMPGKLNIAANGGG